MKTSGLSYPSAEWWAGSIIIICPVTNCDPSMGAISKHGFVEQRVPDPPIEAFDKAILHRLPGCDIVPNLVIRTPAQHALQVSSVPVPLTLTISLGAPRLSINVVSSRTTRLPEIDVSEIAARHSRVTSSMTLKMRNL